MTRRLVGALTAFLVLLAGAWLVLAPFALGTQPAGGAWTDETRTDVWTGAGLLVAGLAGVVAFASALWQYLAERGLAARRPVPAPAPASAQVDPNELETLLRPLITALTADLERDQQPKEQP
jgi:hypothetical protein